MRLQSITYNLKPNPGLTLVEVILYVGLAATILLGISALIASTLESQVKNQTISEIDSQGLSAMEIITQAIRNSQGINSPATGTIASVLSLKINPASINPTVFDSINNTLRITESVDSPILLTNSRVLASNLSFHNLSRPGTSGTVRVQFTLTHLNPENRNEYDYTKTFFGAASLR